MEDRPTPTSLQHRIGILVAIMAGAVAITPLVLAIAIRSADASLRSALLVVAALVWLVALVVYRGLALAHEHWRRRVLRREVATARRARLDASATFQDKLNDQQAILDRIVEISEALVEEGIIDPQLAINKVRLINSHATEAQAFVEDTITEIRAETGMSTVTAQAFDARDEIEEAVTIFVRSGAKVTTAGPRNFAETDAATFRLIVRGLIASAIERGAEDINVSVARNDDTIVCTVSDDGLDNSHNGLSSIPPVTQSLARTVEADLAYTRALHRNQYSVAVPAATRTDSVQHRTTPMDVLGQRHSSTPAPIPAARPHVPRPTADTIITFVDTPERDPGGTVAANREGHLASR